MFLVMIPPSQRPKMKLQFWLEYACSKDNSVQKTANKFTTGMKTKKDLPIDIESQYLVTYKKGGKIYTSLAK